MGNYVCKSPAHTRNYPTDHTHNYLTAGTMQPKSQGAAPRCPEALETTMSKQRGHEKVAFTTPTFPLLFFYYYFFTGQRGRRSLCPVSHQEAAAGDPTPRALPFLPMPTPFAEVPCVSHVAAARFGGALPASELQQHQEIKARVPRTWD